jgi:tRNA (guanine37-N1)-methyltransferase
MRFDFLSLFPHFILPYFEDSILKRAIEKNLIQVQVTNIRDFSENRHKKVDDTPYGGGSGMVMSCQPLYDAIQSVKKKARNSRVIYLSPAGKRFTQKDAERLSHEKGLILVCGRYEGIDQRIIDLLIDEELSIGDFVLTGGELPALSIVDSVARLLPGVLGDAHSAVEESFSDHLDGMIEYPHYTKPELFKRKRVPEVLLSGNHAAIEKWRKENRRQAPNL